MKQKLLLLCLFNFSALLAPTLGYSEDDVVKLSVQMRVRGASDGRDFSAETPAERSTLMRIRLGLDFQPTADITGFFQLQDSRGFGTEPSTKANTANVDLYQGYLHVNDFFTDSVTLKIGRMRLAYGSGRFIGPGNWGNVGRAFDGTVFGYNPNAKLKLELFATKVVQQADPEIFGDTGSYFGGLYATIYNLEAYLLLELNRHQTLKDIDDLRRLTLGTRSKGMFGVLEYEAEAAVQLGTRINTTAKKQQDVFGFILTGLVGYTHDIAQKPRIAVGYDYLSGQTPNDTDFKVFEALHGSTHSRYGYMDYFRNIPVDTNGAGLQDMMLKFQVTPYEKTILKLDLRQLLSAQTVKNANNFGQEVDLTFIYDYHEALSFTLGASIFLPGELMQARFKGNNDMALWGYVMTMANF